MSGPPPPMLESFEGDRSSVEPESRPPWLPPERSSPPPAPSPPIALEVPLPPRVAFELDAKTRVSRASGRPSSESLTAQRLSRISARLSSIRQTILSRLPSIPISRIAQSGPLSALVLVSVLFVGTCVFMWSTGRVPKGIAAALHLNQASAPLAPPSFPKEVAEAQVDESPFPVLDRTRGPIVGGVMFMPTAFTARADGTYDLIIHFHGNTDLAMDSYEAARLDAVVVVFNLGNGSGKYEDHFANPAALSGVLSRTQEALEQRGLPHPKLRRLALVAWSAGYGAVLKILDHDSDAERVDAVLLLDGLHASYREGTHEVEEANIAGVERFAERAKRGEKLFLVNHSDIDPVTYLGVHETVDFVLAKVGVQRHPATGTSEIPKLPSIEGVMPKDEMKPLELTSEAREGGIVVHGYSGNDKATHMEHLMQMSVLALPELFARWQ